MRNVKFGVLALVVLSACSTTTNQTTELTTEQWRKRLFIEKLNGKDLYVATQYGRHVNESLEEGAQRNTYAINKTCPDGHKVREIRASPLQERFVPGQWNKYYVRNIETVFTCL
jgi:hypothetical protein